MTILTHYPRKYAIRVHMELKSHTNLDTFDVSSTPQRFKNQVGETQYCEILDELLSQVVINPAKQDRQLLLYSTLTMSLKDMMKFKETCISFKTTAMKMVKSTQKLLKHQIHSMST